MSEFSLKIRQKTRRACLRTVVSICILLGAAPQKIVAPAMAQATPSAAQQGGGFSFFLPLIQAGGVTLPEPSTTYSVTYSDNTVTIAEDIVADHLRSVSEDQATYHFDPGTQSVIDLVPGQIVFFEGIALRRVGSVTSTDGEVVVETSAAKLNEAITDGTIAWVYPVKWTDLPLSTFTQAQIGEPGAKLQLISKQPVNADSLAEGISFVGKIQDWDVTFKLTPNSTRLDIDLSAKHKIGTAEASVSGKGWISTFAQETLITIEQGKPTKMWVKSIGLSSEMELKWAALTPGSETITKIASFSIPAELPFPINVGPIPVILKLKAGLQIVPELSVLQASSGGSYKVTYGSDQGFGVENNLVGELGQLHNVTIGESGPTGSAGFGPVGFGLGIEFPRLEVTILGQSVAFVTIKTYSTSLYLTDPPCQKGTTLIFARAGYQLELVGFTIAKGEQDIWREEYVKYKDDIKCD